MTIEYHAPIMVQEVLSYIQPERGGIFLDGTLGGGGHAYAMLSRLDRQSVLYGIDRDADAIRQAGERLSPFGDRFVPIRGNFFDMKRLLGEKGVCAVDGILLDLGVSSHQLDEAERGFSYHQEAPLDMRMNRDDPVSAADVVNTYSEAALARIIRVYGEERFAGRIARAIVSEREKAPIVTTTQLAELVRAAMPAKNRYEGKHPARRTFQAIRIEVNHELDGLGAALHDAHGLLAPGGRLAVITFHSLEDRLVKQAFRDWEQPCTCPPKAPVCICGKQPTVRALNRKPDVASEAEQNENPRSRSAKLRALEKIGH